MIARGSRPVAAVVLLLLVALGAWSAHALGIQPATIADSLDNAADFIGRMFPLDFPPLRETVLLLAETLAIVFLATLLSVVLSLPVAVAAAAATGGGHISRGVARTTITVARVLPDLVLAIIFLRMFGLGPVAGILALGLHSVGLVGKLYADAIDELDDGPRESVAAVGATRRQQILAAIPSALAPQIIATALHRFDINLRNSVLLGYVGVGGIGLAISDALRTLNYPRGVALALIVLVLCLLTELLSGAIRAGLARGSTRNRSPQGSRRTTPPWTPARVGGFGSVVLLGVLTVASVRGLDLSAARILQGITEIPATLAQFWPPSTQLMEEILRGIVETLQIAAAATLIGAVLAVPVGVLAARNVAGHPLIHHTFRTIIVVTRGIPELILAIIFVVISGLGGVAGALALSVGAVGLLSKLIADSLEETDRNPQDAARAAGASGTQVFFAATLRQVAPAVISHVLYLLDHNFRSATLLGVVGAGGIGFLLLDASRVNQFDVVTTILILMAVTVLIIEGVSVWLRRLVR